MLRTSTYFVERIVTLSEPHFLEMVFLFHFDPEWAQWCCLFLKIAGHCLLILSGNLPLKASIAWNVISQSSMSMSDKLQKKHTHREREREIYSADAYTSPELLRVPNCVQSGPKVIWCSMFSRICLRCEVTFAPPGMILKRPFVVVASYVLCWNFSVYG